MLFSSPRWSFFQGVSDIWGIPFKSFSGIFGELKRFWGNLGPHVFLITLWWQVKIVQTFMRNLTVKKFWTFFYIESECKIFSNFFTLNLTSKYFSNFFGGIKKMSLEPNLRLWQHFFLWKVASFCVVSKKYVSRSKTKALTAITSPFSQKWWIFWDVRKIYVSRT